MRVGNYVYMKKDEAVPCTYNMLCGTNMRIAYTQCPLLLSTISHTYGRDATRRTTILHVHINRMQYE